MDKDTEPPEVKESIDARGSQGFLNKPSGSVKQFFGTTIIQNIFQGGTEAQRAYRNRQNMLQLVWNTWIEGVLKKSLYNEMLIELGIETRPDAVEYPWDMVKQMPDIDPMPVSPGTKMSELFEKMNGAMLILGEPGSGKTTMLLELARQLIDFAKNDPTQFIPVVFNLSSWTSKQTFADWLITELRSKYYIPNKIAQDWIDNDELILLLDGLDEVKAENQRACVQKINGFRTEHNMPLVICSRKEEYESLNEHLKLGGAILIKSLTTEQIDCYLQEAGTKLTIIHQTLKRDLELREFTQTPLILSILILTYRNLHEENLKALALATNYRKHLFDTYISQMFKRKVGALTFDNAQTRQRLSWLARNMQWHNQGVFLIESLQPSWLKEHKWKRAYYLASRSIGGLSIGLMAGLSVGMAFALITAAPDLRGGIPTLQELLRDLVNKLLFMLNVGLIIGSALGLIGGLSVGFIDLLRFKASRKSNNTKGPPTFWQSVANVLVVGLILVLSVGLIGGLVGGFFLELLLIGDGSIEFEGFLIWTVLIALLTGPMAGLIGGLIFGLRGSRQSIDKDIQTVEALSWSWSKSLKGIPIGLIAGLIVAMIASWLSRLLDSPHPQLEGLSLGLCIGLLGPLFSGLKGNIVEAKTFPNQGIRLSRQNATFVGLIAGSIGVLFIGIFFGLVEVPIFGLNIGVIIGSISGLIVGSMGGLIVALWYGGLDIIQHYTLRLILIIQSFAPANYARFLDYAVDRIFLQKVGGGYRFIHRMLMEHFAAMAADSPETN